MKISIPKFSQASFLQSSKLVILLSPAFLYIFDLFVGEIPKRHAQQVVEVFGVVFTFALDRLFLPLLFLLRLDFC